MKYCDIIHQYDAHKFFSEKLSKVTEIIFRDHALVRIKDRTRKTPNKESIKGNILKKTPIRVFLQRNKVLRIIYPYSKKRFLIVLGDLINTKKNIFIVVTIIIEQKKNVNLKWKE